MAVVRCRVRDLPFFLSPRSNFFSPSLSHLSLLSISSCIEQSDTCAYAVAAPVVTFQENRWRKGIPSKMEDKRNSDLIPRVSHSCSKFLHLFCNRSIVFSFPLFLLFFYEIVSRNLHLFIYLFRYFVGGIPFFFFAVLLDRVIRNVLTIEIL